MAIAPRSCSRCSTRSTTRGRRAAVERYRVEPYVVAADVYSHAAAHRPRRLDLVHRVRRLDVSGRRGIDSRAPPRRPRLRIAPSIPANWPGFSAILTRPDGTRIRIEVRNPDGVMQGLRELRLDGHAVDGTEVALPADGAKHELVAVMGVPAIS